jgi:hypothetical protein
MAEVNAALQQLLHIDYAQKYLLLVFTSAEICPPPTVFFFVGNRRTVPPRVFSAGQSISLLIAACKADAASRKRAVNARKRP